MLKGKDLKLAKDAVTKKRKFSEIDCESLDSSESEKHFSSTSVVNVDYDRGLDGETGESSVTIENQNADYEIFLDDSEIPDAPVLSDSDVTKKKVKVYARKFNVSWLSNPKYQPWLEKTDNCAFCRLCYSKIQNSVFFLDRHIKCSTHIEKMKNIKSNSSINTFSVNTFVKQNTNIDKAELKMTMFLAEHNLPFLLLDHLGKLIRSCAPDSEIFKKVKINRKKGTFLMKNVIATENRDSIQEDLKSTPYTLITDKSTDIGTIKCMAVIVRYFKDSRVIDRFLDLVPCENGTAEGIFAAIEECLKKNKVDMQMMIGFGADNCSVMMGKYNSVKTRLEATVKHIFVFGCCCHLMHLCAVGANANIPKYIEELTRDIYSHFAFSTKRRIEFAEYQQFLEIEFHQILRSASTRWLSLEVNNHVIYIHYLNKYFFLQAATNRLLEQWDALQLYFTNCSFDAKKDVECIRTEFMVQSLRNPITKSYFLFLSHILKILNGFNTEFQSEKSLIHLVIPRITTIFRTISRSFMKNEKVKDVDVLNIEFARSENWLAVSEIFVGTKAELFIKQQKNIDQSRLMELRRNIRGFYIELLKQFLKRFKFNDPVLKVIGYFTPSVALSGDVGCILEICEFFPIFENVSEEINNEWRLLAETEDGAKYRRSETMEMSFCLKI